MFACVQAQLSIQIAEYLYHYLQFDASDMNLTKLMQPAFTKLIEKSQGIVTSPPTPNFTSLAHITGTFVKSAATKAAARTIIVEGAETAAETVSAAGYNTALRTVALVTGGTMTLGVSVVIKLHFLPLEFIRHIERRNLGKYHLKRPKGNIRNKYVRVQE